MLGLDRRGGRSRTAKRQPVVKKEPTVTLITVAETITIRDLAEKLQRSNAEIIKALMQQGTMATANQSIDFEAASAVAESFNVLVEEYVEVDVFEAAFSATPDSDDNMLPRPPVVVVMGHVDHGKTSLLDVIRNANVQAGEAGGITQHIGAYSVRVNEKRVTFLDTPGHEAFTAMRMRGAQVTDIAILVVAANDGVMPQTIEAINHAKAAGVEIIVAINKMDLPDANPDRVKQELTDKDLQPEDWGGTTITVPVSAKKKEGIDTLLEMILLSAEMKELRANPNKPARGSIIEAKLDKGRGPVATVLVQDGTLRVGDPVVAGACFGKVRAMVDSRGRNVKEAGPSTPVEIIGLADVPATGDTLYAATSDKQARQLSETVVAKGRESLIKTTQGKVSLDDLFSQIQAGQVKDLNIVVKGDVQGSVEALRGSLEKLENPEVRVRIIHTGVGAITESDVMLASASNAIILGFNVRPDTSAKNVAEAENVDMRMYSVIYAAIDDIEAAMKGMLAPVYEEKVLGYAEIRQIFKASGIGTIGGCYVTEGKILRNAKVRIVRDGRVVYDGTLDTLKRFKDDAREVASGYECGMLFHRYNDIKEGDKVEAYEMQEIPR
jgi:translation initiation factor IF-2